MTQKSRLTKWGFLLLFCMFMGFGLSMDASHFKDAYGYEMYWVFVSVAFAGLGVSIFNVAGLSWVAWADSKAWDMHKKGSA